MAAAQQKRSTNPLTLVLLLSAGFFVLFLVITGIVFMTGSWKTQKGTALFSTGTGSIGVVEVTGVIMDSKDVLKKLERFEDDESIKGVLLRLDSPGGSVGPSQEIYQAVKDYKKPVIASMASVAASGAYYIACGADKIYANPGTITGSIGVIMQFANLAKLYEWAKIERYAVKTGKFKDIGAEYRSLGPDERELLEAMVNDVLEQFKRAIAEGRSLSMPQVTQVADGRIMSGAQAKALKLVDELGGMNEAVKALAKEAKIKGEPKLVYPEKERQRLIDFILEGAEEDYVSAPARGLPASIGYLIDRITGTAGPRQAGISDLTPGVYWLWSGAH